jgi:hypothetical protein
MGLRALERRLVLLRAFLAVREEVDRYLDLAKQRRRLPNPADLTGALRNRGLDPPGLLEGRDYLWHCGKDGVTPDRDDLVCRILGMEDRWISRAIEDSTPDEFRKGPTKAQRSAILAQGKEQLREFNRRFKREREDLLRKVREAQAQAKAAAASAKADRAAERAAYAQRVQAAVDALDGMRRGVAGRTE